MAICDEPAFAVVSSMDSLSEAVFKEGYEVVTSQPYRTVEMRLHDFPMNRSVGVNLFGYTDNQKLKSLH